MKKIIQISVMVIVLIWILSCKKNEEKSVFSISTFPEKIGELNDFAHILKPMEAENVVGKLKEIKENTGFNVIITTFKNIPKGLFLIYVEKLYAYWEIKEPGLFLVYVENPKQQFGWMPNEIPNDVLSKIIQMGGLQKKGEKKFEQRFLDILNSIEEELNVKQAASHRPVYEILREEAGLELTPYAGDYYFLTNPEGADIRFSIDLNRYKRRYVSRTPDVLRSPFLKAGLENRKFKYVLFRLSKGKYGEEKEKIVPLNAINYRGNYYVFTDFSMIQNPNINLTSNNQEIDTITQSILLKDKDILSEQTNEGFYLKKLDGIKTRIKDQDLIKDSVEMKQILSKINLNPKEYLNYIINMESIYNEVKILNKIWPKSMNDTTLNILSGNKKSAEYKLIRRIVTEKVRVNWIFDKILDWTSSPFLRFAIIYMVLIIFMYFWAWMRENQGLAIFFALFLIPSSSIPLLRLSFDIYPEYIQDCNLLIVGLYFLFYSIIIVLSIVASRLFSYPGYSHHYSDRIKWPQLIYLFNHYDDEEKVNYNTYKCTVCHFTKSEYFNPCPKCGTRFNRTDKIVPREVEDRMQNKRRSLERDYKNKRIGLFIPFISLSFLVCLLIHFGGLLSMIWGKSIWIFIFTSLINIILVIILISKFKPEDGNIYKTITFKRGIRVN